MKTTKTKLILLALCLGLLNVFLSCDKDNVVLSDDASILGFTFPEETGPPIIDCSNNTVYCEVENGSDLSNLSPAITISEGASIPDNITIDSIDFSDPVPIPITAESGTIRNWIVHVSDGPSDATDILAFFMVPEQTSHATIEPITHTVAIEVVNGTDMADLTPRFSVSIGAYSVPESGTNGDFSSDVTIRVFAEDRIAFQDWTVKVIEAPVGISSETDILTFLVPEQTRAPYIDGENHRVSYAVDTDVNLTNLTPSFTLSPGATSVPASETTGDYTNIVTITVTAEDGTTTQDWTVDVYNVEEFDSSIFCDENLCTDDDALQQECQDFLLGCLATQSGKDYDECLISALLICKQ